MLDANSASVAVKKIQEPAIKCVIRSAEERLEEMAAYKRIDQEFREYLETYYAGHLSQASRDIVWKLAYENGIGDYYAGVEYCYKDYAELDDELVATLK